MDPSLLAPNVECERGAIIAVPISTSWPDGEEIVRELRGRGKENSGTK